LLAADRVDAALVPVIAYQTIDGVKLIPGVCVGAKQRVRSVCLVTKGPDLENVRSVSLDVSSRTSVILTKIIFREFLGFEPEWRDAEPDIDAMLAESDAALLIGDPALSIAECGMRNAQFSEGESTEIHPSRSGHDPALRNQHSTLRVYDLAELWNRYTGLGFVFAMWMTRRENCPIDFAAARDEGLGHLESIAANYGPQIGLSDAEMLEYLSQNISYSIDRSMQQGLELYFELAFKNRLTESNSEIRLV
jgi:chorismate dehydratase